MALLELEGNLFNTDDIEMVRAADTNAEGFLTELVFVNGMQLLKMPLAEAEQLIIAANNKA